MQKIKAFFYTFYKSLTSLEYYKDIIKTNTSFSLKYFFALAPIAAVILTAVTIVPLTPRVTGQVKNFLNEGRKLYPENLVITSKEGTVSINQPEPYTIPTPKGFFDQQDGEDIPANLIVFDSDGTLDDLETYDTWVLVNSNNALIKSTNRVEVSPLKDMPEGEYSQEDFNQMITQAEEVVKVIPYIMIIGGFFAVLLYYIIFRLVYLLFVGLTLWVMGLVRGLKLSYQSYFKIAVHTFTFPLIAELIVSALNINPGIPFWIFGLNWIFGLVVIWHLSKPEGNQAVMTSSATADPDKEKITEPTNQEEKI